MQHLKDYKVLRDRAYKLSTDAAAEAEPGEAASLDTKSLGILHQLEEAFPEHGLITVVVAAYEHGILQPYWKHAYLSAQVNG